MNNKHSSDKSVGIFLLTVLSFIFVFKYEYVAVAVWPAVVSQFPVLWKKAPFFVIATMYICSNC